MPFGKIIKELRRDADMTQERLAELLSISPQAVSRWETDSAMPDISLLPALANIFNVTTDYLLDVDITKRDERIEEISEKAWEQQRKSVELYNNKEVHQGIWKAIEIVDEGLKTYPDSWQLKKDMIALRFCWYDEDIDVLRENQREIVKICEDIIANCNDEKLRQSAIFDICFLSRALNNTERAKELIKEAPPMSFSQEMLRLAVLEGEELRQMNLYLIGKFLGEISNCIFSLTNDPDMSAEEVLELEKRSVELYRVMYGNDDFSVMFPTFTSPYQLTEKLALRGNNDLAFKVLEAEYNRMIKLSEKEYKNISPYVHKNASGMDMANYSVEEWQTHFCWEIDNSSIEFMEKYFPDTFKSDPRYEEFKKRLFAYREKYGTK